MSLVLVSPSTDSWSQVLAAAGRSRPHSVSGVDGRVGQHDREHRGHPRMDHPDALGDAAQRDRHGPAVGVGQLDRRGHDLGHRIGRAQRLRGRAQRVIGRGKRRHDQRQSVAHLVERQPRPDDPGRQVERALDLDACGRRQHPGDRGLVVVTRLAGRRVGRSAGRDDGVGIAEPPARVGRRRGQVGARPPDRRRGKAVRREDGGHGGRSTRRHDDGEVGPARGLDPDRQPTGRKAGGHGGSSLDRWEDRRGHRDGQIRQGGHARLPFTVRAEAAGARPSRAGRGRG